ncbi:hypothetical protein [Turicibacter sanguinis]|uniref:hypothetical protein n=1 Tax=Turicibacter sanguinis TaxID=154288 RepID=UPI0018AB9512|nr:hypothetical protein [Turicibacter sanguinis]MDB8552173.1 hypothetical protein [Turicibacter sanguinis]
MTKLKENPFSLETVRLMDMKVIREKKKNKVAEYLGVKYGCEALGIDFKDCEIIAIQNPVTIKEVYVTLKEFALRGAYDEAIKIYDICGYIILKRILRMLVECEKSCCIVIDWRLALNSFIEVGKG